MISVYHLFWIVPVAAMVGFLFAALMCAAHDEENAE